MFCTLVNILVSKELKKEAGYVESNEVKQGQTLNLCCRVQAKVGWQANWAQGPNKRLIKYLGKLLDVCGAFQEEKTMGRDVGPSCKEYRCW